jgi:hypothetical protein
MILNEQERTLALSDEASARIGKLGRVFLDLRPGPKEAQWIYIADREADMRSDPTRLQRMFEFSSYRILKGRLPTIAV